MLDYLSLLLDLFNFAWIYLCDKVFLDDKEIMIFIFVLVQQALPGIYQGLLPIASSLVFLALEIIGDLVKDLHES